jgi:hypothetical protein
LFIALAVAFIAFDAALEGATVVVTRPAGTSAALVRRLRDRLGEGRVENAIERVAERAIDPYAAVDELLRE